MTYPSSASSPVFTRLPLCVRYDAVRFDFTDMQIRTPTSIREKVLWGVGASVDGYVELFGAWGIGLYSLSDVVDELRARGMEDPRVFINGVSREFGETFCRTYPRAASIVGLQGADRMTVKSSVDSQDAEDYLPQRLRRTVRRVDEAARYMKPGLAAVLHALVPRYLTLPEVVACAETWLSGAERRLAAARNGDARLRRPLFRERCPVRAAGTTRERGLP